MRIKNRRKLLYKTSGNLTRITLFILLNKMLFFTVTIHLSLIFIVKICQGVERPLVIGHRGSAYLPELTLESQSIGHAFGADMVEIDICLTRDNQLIVIHGNKFQSFILNSF